MKQYIGSLHSTNLKLKDFEYSRTPKISSIAKILSSERKRKIAKIKFPRHYSQQFVAPLGLDFQKIGQSNKQATSANESSNKPNTLDQSPTDKNTITSAEYNSLLASIDLEIEELINSTNEKSGAKTCPACQEIFENSVFLSNHYYVFHQIY